MAGAQAAGTAGGGATIRADEPGDEPEAEATEAADPPDPLDPWGPDPFGDAWPEGPEASDSESTVF